MSEHDGAAIDPRYDPAFQRGFEGEVQTGAHGQSTLRRTAAVNPAPARPAAQRVEEVRVGPVPTPSAFAPESERPPVVGLPGMAGSPTSPDGAEAQVPMVAGAASVATPRELLRNPFVIALAALAAVLILAGAVWAYEGFATIVKNGGTRNEVEFWAAQTMSFGAPLAIVVGLAVVAALLVVFGRGWQRSRPTS